MKRTDGTKRNPNATAEQVAYIRVHYATQTSVEIAATLGMRAGTVKQWASRLSLRKNSKRLTEIRKAARGHAPTRIGNPDGRGWVPGRTHPFALLLGRKPIDIPVASVRVHRILDDEELAA